MKAKHGGFLRGAGVRFVILFIAAAAAERATPAAPLFVAAADENAQVYIAEWSAASNAFVNFRQIDALRRTEGESAYGRHVVVGDFTGDGHDDIVVARRLGAGYAGAFLLVNSGSNTFTRTACLGDTATGDYAMDGAAGDFNADGLLDFTVGGNSTTMGVYLSQDGGTFVDAEWTGLEGSSRGTDAADFDHDGRLDLVRGSYSTGNIRFHRGNGDGTFAAGTLVGDAGGDPYGVTAGDFDNDGHPDLIANSDSAGNVLLFRGNGDGTFAAGVAVTNLDFNQHGSFDAYDFTGDGVLDVVAADYTGRRVRFYAGASTGTFAASVTVGTMSNSCLAISAPPLPPPARTPRAVLQVTPAVTPTNAPVGFDGSASGDPDGVLASNRWDFGDGAASNWTTGAPGVTSHLYAVETSVIARLWVGDDSNRLAVAGRRLQVQAAAPFLVTNLTVFGPASASNGLWSPTLLATGFVGDAEALVRAEWMAVRLSDGFESGSAPAWDPLVGAWSVSSVDPLAGSYSYLQTNAASVRARVYNTNWIAGDFVCEAEVKIVSGLGQIGLVYRAGNDQNRYEFLVRADVGDLRFERLDDGASAVVQTIPLPATIATGVTHRLRLERSGAFFHVRVDGLYVGSVRDATFAAGHVGLVADRTAARFDDVRVRLLGRSLSFVPALPAGTNAVTIVGTDAGGSSITAAVNVVCEAGLPPVADAGGPYAVDEFTGSSYGGGFLVALDAGGTVDPDSPSNTLTFVWDFGLDTFDAIDPGKWYLPSAGVTRSGSIGLAGNGTWGARYAVTRDLCPRRAGACFEARVRSHSGNAMAGFFNTGTTFSYTVMPYAMYFNSGSLVIYEDGTLRGTVAAYATGVVYEVRIELKPTQGARYYWRPAGGGTSWELVYDSTYGTAASFRRGLTAGTGSAELDDLRETVAGQTASWRVWGTGVHPGTLTVTDPAGNADTDAFSVTASPNAPPVANAGLDRVLAESNAIWGIWTSVFSAAASTDDHGIYSFEWDWDYDGTTFAPSGDTASNLTHAWTQPGVYTAAVRVTDQALQSQIDACILTIVPGSPPVADPGGPYVVDEITGNARREAWQLTLDGSGSSDPDSPLAAYRWTFGTNTFDGARLSPSRWIFPAAGVTQSNALRLVGTGTWGQRYAVTRDAIPRAAQQVFQARFRSTAAGNAMIGFHNGAATYSYTEFPYALYFSSGSLLVYEDGTSRGTFGSYTNAVWYDVRIELKATQGARFLWRPAGAAAWTPVYDSTYGTLSTLRAGVTVDAGTFEFDDMLDTAAGPTPDIRAYNAGTSVVELVVWDPALNAHTQTTYLVCLRNDPPTADAGPDHLGTESNATEGIWWFTFDAGGSTDDQGIYTYEWDFDYQPALGFRPSGKTNAIVVQHFDVSRLGTNTVAVRVTDHVLQSDLDTCRVVLLGSAPPIAHPGEARTVEVGYPLTFDGSGSQDDVGVARYEWAFGDGGVGVGPSPWHVYGATGTYEVVLVVYDATEQASAPATGRVTVVVSTPPVADAGGPYAAGAGGPPALFDALHSSDPGDTGVVQGVARCLWDVDIATDSGGNGIPDDDLDLLGHTPFYTYAAVGTYTARLTVVDGAGQLDLDDCTVVVHSNLPPQVICVPHHGSPDIPHLCVTTGLTRLKAIVRDAGTLTYRWDFGDGATTTVATVTNKYIVEATHAYTGSDGRPLTATLTVWDSAGLSGRDTYALVVRATSVATRAAIAVDDGLWFLHKDQNRTTGRWNRPYSASYHASAAASAVQAFEINGHTLTGDPGEDPYVETVDLGFRALFNLTTNLTLSLQGAFNPDSNSNGVGITLTEGDDGYQLGMVMDAVASSQAPLAVVPSGPAGIKHRSFLEVLTDMADTVCFGMNDTGTDRGGWRYEWNYGSSDNSICQWNAIGLLAARDLFGIPTPAYVRDMNRLWVAYSFDGAGFGYSAPGDYPWGWYSTTPSALVQMAADGDRVTNAIWRAAEDFLAANWPIESAASKLYYAHYAFAKAMRLARPRPVVVFPSTGVNWFDDPAVGLRPKLVGQQSADGSWYGYAKHGNGYALGYDLSTAWAITMLTPSIYSRPPVAVITAPPVWGFDQPLAFRADGSFHIDPSRAILYYDWDFNGDGTYDYRATSPDDPAAAWTYPDPHPGVPGDGPFTVTVRLRVTDDQTPAQTDTVEHELTVAEPPHAPLALPGGPYLAVAGFPVTLDASASYDIDPGDSITRYAWDFTGDEIADLETNSPLLILTYPSTGSRAVALSVRDNGVLNGGTNLWSDWEYATILVASNAAPVAAPGGPYAVLEDVPLVLNGSASYDPNAPLHPIASYAWDLNNDGLSDAATAVVSGLTWSAGGVYPVRLVVSDGLLASTGTTTVTVTPVNDAPSFVKGTNVVVPWDDAPRTLPAWAAAITAGPPDEAGQALAFHVSNNRAWMFAAPPSVSPDGTLGFRASVWADGTATVQLYLEDDGGTAYGGTNRSPTQSFTLRVIGDSDGDGLHDRWENFYWSNLVTASATSDYDGDHVLDAHEYIADTIPTNPLSYLRLEALGPAAGLPGWNVTWQSVTTRTYTLQRATNLPPPAVFSDITNDVPGQAGQTSARDPDPTTPANRYYRVRVAWPPP